MAAKRSAAGATAANATALLGADGAWPPTFWGNGPGYTYGWHEHRYHKILFCLSGSIVFHTLDGDVELAAGDRLDLDPWTEHAATVGPQGCACVEAAR